MLIASTLPTPPRSWENQSGMSSRSPWLHLHCCQRMRVPMKIKPDSAMDGSYRSILLRLRTRLPTGYPHRGRGGRGGGDPLPVPTVQGTGQPRGTGSRISAEIRRIFIVVPVPISGAWALYAAPPGKASTFLFTPLSFSGMAAGARAVRLPAGAAIAPLSPRSPRPLHRPRSRCASLPGVSTILSQ